MISGIEEGGEMPFRQPDGNRRFVIHAVVILALVIVITLIAGRFAPWARWPAT